MKFNTIVILVAMSTTIAACSSDKPPGPEIPPPGYNLELETRSLTFGANDTEPQFIKVTAENVNWDILTDERHDWFDVEKDNGRIKVYAVSNPLEGERSGTFTVTSDVSSVASIVVTVSQDGLILEPQYDLVFTSAEAYYYEQFHDETGNTFFALNLMSEGIYTEDNYLKGSGRVAYIEFFSEVPESKVFPEVAPGTYRFNNSHDKFSAVPGLYDDYWEMYSFSTLKTIVNGSAVSVSGIAGGSFEVEKEGTEYRIVVDLAMDNGTRLTGIYEGALPCHNNYMSDLTDDLEISDLTSGDVTFYGDYYENGTYNWIVYMWSEGVSLDEEEGYLKGSGNVIWMDITSDPTRGNLHIPASIYTIDESLEADTAFPGALDYFSGYMVGCWYAEYEQDRIVRKAPMMTGTINFSFSTDLYATVSIAVKDDIGFDIAASYQGNIDYLYYSEAYLRENSSPNRYKRYNPRFGSGKVGSHPARGI